MKDERIKIKGNKTTKPIKLAVKSNILFIREN
jgi:hypothetical protein